MSLILSQEEFDRLYWLGMSHVGDTAISEAYSELYSMRNSLCECDTLSKNCLYLYLYSMEQWDNNPTALNYLNNNQMSTILSRAQSLLNNCGGCQPDSNCSAVVSGVNVVINGTDATLTWTASGGASFYKVFRDGIGVGTTPTLSLVVTGNSIGAHTYAIVPHCIDGIGTAFSGNYTIAQPPVCSAPTLLTVSNNNTDLRLTWGIVTNGNIIEQQLFAKPRYDSGAPFLQTGFTPPSPVASNVSTAYYTPALPNRVWQFKVASVCTVGGPTFNSNGIQEGVLFGCFGFSAPTVLTTNDVTFMQDMSDTDIIKARITFINTATGISVGIGFPKTVTVVNGILNISATLPDASTEYEMRAEFIALVNGIEVISSNICTVRTFTTATLVCPSITNLLSAAPCNSDVSEVVAFWTAPVSNPISQFLLIEWRLRPSVIWLSSGFTLPNPMAITATNNSIPNSSAILNKVVQFRVTTNCDPGVTYSPIREDIAFFWNNDKYHNVTDTTLTIHVELHLAGTGVTHVKFLVPGRPDQVLTSFVNGINDVTFTGLTPGTDYTWTMLFGTTLNGVLTYSTCQMALSDFTTQASAGFNFQVGRSATDPYTNDSTIPTYVDSFDTAFTHNGPLSAMIPSGWENSFVVYRWPSAEPPKTTWFNTLGINQGTLGDSIWRLPFTIGSYTYAVSRDPGGISIDFTQPLILE